MSTDVITNANAKSRTKVRMMVQIGMLAAISVVLMQFEVPLPFAPAFYKIDFSEVPVLVGCFAMGPFAGAVIELIKIILHVAISGTTTAGVGDVANFLIGCAFMTVVGCFLNAFVLLPTYAKAFGMPIDALVGMGSAINGKITGLSTFVVFAVAPFNLLKGVLVSMIVFLIYKKISPIFKMGH